VIEDLERKTQQQQQQQQQQQARGHEEGGEGRLTQVKAITAAATDNKKATTRAQTNRILKCRKQHNHANDKESKAPHQCTQNKRKKEGLRVLRLTPCFNSRGREAPIFASRPSKIRKVGFPRGPCPCFPVRHSTHYLDPPHHLQALTLGRSRGRGVLVDRFTFGGGNTCCGSRSLLLPCVC